MESSTITKRIAFVQACWHREVVDEGREHDDAHQKFFHEHFKVKGAEAAVACVKTQDNVKKVLAAS